jgi:hypothetical protein
VIVAAIITVWLVGLFAIATRAARADHRTLRRCPRCGAPGVRAARYQGIDVIQTRAALQCGQCGIWRRLKVTRAEQHSHTRRLGRDRRRIRKAMLRLEAERRSLDMLTFVALLRSDMSCGSPGSSIMPARALSESGHDFSGRHAPTALATTTVTGVPSASTRAGRSSRSQRDPPSGSVDSRISS